MKRNLYSLVIIVFAASCINLYDSMDKQFFELSVQVNGVGFEQLKNDDLGDVPECQNLSMDYAIFVIEFLDENQQYISSEEFKTEIYTPNNYIVTQPIKIEMDQKVIQYARLSSFMVYHDDGDAQTLDPIVKAAPAIGSKYATFVTNAIDKVFEVRKFTKEEVVLDVLCFDPLYIVSFGFTWINLNDIIIRNQCWLANLCVDNPTDYNGSLYQTLNANGLSNQMPAILKVNVLNYVGEANGDYDDDVNWDLLITHDNNTAETYGQDICLEVLWPDNIERDDLFRFDVYVLMAAGDGQFEYQFYNSYAFWNDNKPDFGTDGVANFDVGDCAIRSFGGCTLTQGFWKNHTGINKKTGLHYWGDESKPKPNYLFLNTGLTYLQVLNNKPSESKYYILAHQYIAAKLNIEVGEVDISACPEVLEHYNAATQLLSNYSPGDNLSSVMDELIHYAETLDLFNNGVLCAQHCD